MAQPLHITTSDGVLEIMLDRPKANAIDAETSRRMGSYSLRSAKTPSCA
ncbi:MAG: hypothetical protein K0S81_2580 [Rhodospirillales bacterium]|nr:hypothetical protein [Rhodospirillales bacterium]